MIRNSKGKDRCIFGLYRFYVCYPIIRINLFLNMFVSFSLFTVQIEKGKIIKKEVVVLLSCSTNIFPIRFSFCPTILYPVGKTKNFPLSRRDVTKDLGYKDATTLSTFSFFLFFFTLFTKSLRGRKAPILDAKLDNKHICTYIFRGGRERERRC